MQSKAKTADAYIETLPDDRAEIIAALRNEIKKNLPEGFEETMQYGMISYVVPHKLYPPGYHHESEGCIAFYEYSLTKKSYCSLSHGRVWGLA